MRDFHRRHTSVQIEALETVMLDSDNAHAEIPKPPPEVPVRVFLKSQLMAALRQHARPIVIEDQVLARPFVRLLRARELRLRAVNQPVLWRRHRSALVHRAIRPSGRRAASDLKGKGTSASYAGHKLIGVHFEVPSINARVSRPTFLPRLRWL